MKLLAENRLPDTLYAWVEEGGGEYSLNIEPDGSRPTPEDGEVRRAGVYVLSHVVDVAILVHEEPVEL